MLKVADAVALARPGLSLLLHRSCLLQLQGKTPPRANRAQEGLEKVVWPEDEERDQRLLLLPICSLVTSAVDTNNGNVVTLHCHPISRLLLGRSQVASTRAGFLLLVQTQEERRVR